MADYGAPLTATRKSALYGPPPWHFAGRALSIYFETDPDNIDKLLPPPLKSPRDGPRAGIGRFSINEFVCDWGFGDEITWKSPRRGLCREGLIALPAVYEDNMGELDAVLWCDNDAEIAACREVYGWAHKMAEVHMSWPFHSQFGPGAHIGGVVTRYQSRVARAEVTLEKEISADDLPEWGSFLGFRYIPSASPDRPSIKELIVEELGEKVLTDVWECSAELELIGEDNEEIAELNPFKITAAYYLKNEWLKMPAKVIPLPED